MEVSVSVYCVSVLLNQHIGHGLTNMNECGDECGFGFSHFRFLEQRISQKEKKRVNKSFHLKSK